MLVIVGCLLVVCQAVVGQGCGSPSQDLLRATSDGDIAAVQSLLRCPGVDVNVQDAANYGYTPLINAARNGDRQMVQVLTRAPNIDVYKADAQWERTPLYWASYYG